MIKIIVMDSHPVFRLGLGSILEGNPEFRVVGDAANVQEALSRIVEGQPDILVMDASGPNNTLEESLNLLQVKHPQVKVIVLTDSDKKDDFFKAIKSGAKGYLMKNLEFPELIDSIRLVASGNAIVYSAMAAKLVSSPEELNRKEGANGFNNLSAREKEVLVLVAQGASNKEIAIQCCISPTTVKAHLRRILEKMEVKNRAHAVAIALEKGYLSKSINN